MISQSLDNIHLNLKKKIITCRHKCVYSTFILNLTLIGGFGCHVGGTQAMFHGSL